jgi:hypothetical protein
MHGPMGHFHLKCNTPAPREVRARVASKNRNNLSLANLILEASPFWGRYLSEVERQSHRR